MKDFFCINCRLHKKIELLGKTKKIHKGIVKYCKSCNEKIDKRIKQLASK